LIREQLVLNDQAHALPDPWGLIYEIGWGSLFIGFLISGFEIWRICGEKNGSPFFFKIPITSLKRKKSRKNYVFPWFLLELCIFAVLKHLKNSIF
jgi:hypothetical protein